MNNLMIPKIIHYCWFGRGKKPELAINCIESWKKFLPEYKIIEWNEDNFDVNIIPYTREAYRLKKYAFVSDYARFWILYKYGGIYFDTDVEIIKPIEDIIERGSFTGMEYNILFTGYKGLENCKPVNPGLGIGVIPNLDVIKEMLDFYHYKHYLSWTGGWTGTVVEFFTRKVLNGNEKELEDGILESKGIYIYPADFFCPKDYYTGEIQLTDNTRTIHHYAASWVPRISFISKIWNRLVKFYIRHS